MKKEVHPKYQQVLFVDSSTGYKFVCGSSLKTNEKEIYEGKEYPLYRVSISSASHPLFTGSKQLVDAEGRVDKFLKRYAAKPVQKSDEGEEDSENDRKEKSKSEPKKKPAKKK